VTTIADFRKAVNPTQPITISVIGRKTGKKISTPVMVVIDSEKLYLLPRSGTDTNWYKNIVKTPTLELEASGRKISAEAHPIHDKKLVEAIVQKFRGRMGEEDFRKYYPKTNVALELSI
jgi:deazaflavin-dependent oxidoreductase (nitroreductase family)